MDQHQPTTRTPLPRLLVRLLVLGGAAIVWWLLISGGPAQADDTGSGVLAVPDATTAAAVPAPASPAVDSAVQVTPGVVHQTVTTVTTPLRDLPRQTAATVSQATSTSPEPVRQATQQLTATLEPTLASTTNTLADAVDQAATRVDGTVVDPVLQNTGLEATPAATTTSDTDAVATAATATPTTLHRDLAKTAQHRRSVARDAALPITHHAISVASSRVDVSAAVEQRSNQNSPSAPNPPGAPTSTSTGAAAAVLAGLAVLVPALLQRRRGHVGDPLPAGPAYPPGSSPG